MKEAINEKEINKCNDVDNNNCEQQQIFEDGHDDCDNIDDKKQHYNVNELNDLNHRLNEKLLSHKKNILNSLDNSNVDFKMSNNKNSSSPISANSIKNASSSRHNRNQHHQLIKAQTSFNTSSTSTTSTAISKKKSEALTYQRPPDGGWGWMVVFASFIINLIADGVSLSFGVIFVELVEYFNESKSKTAWVGSLFLSIPLLTGPVASALVDNFGCRRVTIAGALLAATGFFLGNFSTKIEHLFVTFSISGFGLSLCYVTSIVSVAYWFEKRRSLATGLAVCGTGFGTFLFAPFIRFLMKEYQWRGTLLILSGVFLNMICCGFLIRDLNIDTSASSTSYSSSSSSSSDSISDFESNLSDSDGDNLSDNETNANARQHNTSNLTNRHRLLKPRVRPLSECEVMEESYPQHTASLINIPTYIKSNGREESSSKNQESIKTSKEQIFNELTFRRGGYLHNLICHYPHLLTMFMPWDMQCDDLTVKTKIQSPDSKLASTTPPLLPPKTSQKVEFGSIHHMDSNHKLHNCTTNEALQAPPECEYKTRTSSTVGRFTQFLNFARQSYPPRHSSNYLQQTVQQPFRGNRLHNLRLPRGSLTYRSAMLVINKYRLKASSAPDIYRTSMVTLNEEKSFTFLHSFKEILLNMVDISNFKSLRYSIFCLSNFLLHVCIDVPYVYIPDQVITTGVSDKEGASIYISIIGVFNTFGIVFVGYIGDKPWLDASYLYAILVSISGLSMISIPLSTNNLVIAIQSAIYGFSISANYSLVSVILVELISLDSFTAAYGMLLLVQGFGSLVGPPIAGWLFDLFGSYNYAFYFIGITILLSGLLVIPVGNKKNCFLWKPPSSTSDEESVFSAVASEKPHTINKNSTKLKNDSANVKRKNDKRVSQSSSSSPVSPIKEIKIIDDSKI